MKGGQHPKVWVPMESLKGRPWKVPWLSKRKSRSGVKASIPLLCELQRSQPVLNVNFIPKPLGFDHKPEPYLHSQILKLDQ
uniref:Uncharacterized protein n=1 Tax=Vitis vinifera TaxID=29760 RepID=F6HA51_VITVI